MERQENKWGLLDWLILLIALVPIIGAVVMYDQLPEQLASHFDANWEPDGYQDKDSFIGILAVVGLLPVLLKYLRKLDPKKENYEKFIRAYNIFRLSISLLLSVAMGSVLLYNLGYGQLINFRMVVFPMLGLFFMVVGNYMGQIRHNYLMGIRTPWTLASEEVWRKTHRLAAPLWMVGGVCLIVFSFLPNVNVGWAIGLTLAVTAGVPVVASYFYFRNLK
jgi:uncharacterized membrane protein